MKVPTVTPKEAGRTPYPFVYVEHDGSYRELLDDEREHLETPFHPADGSRPYVKSSYFSRTPAGRLDGFLRRSRLPRNLAPGQPDPPKYWWRLW